MEGLKSGLKTPFMSSVCSRSQIGMFRRQRIEAIERSQQILRYVGEAVGQFEVDPGPGTRDRRS
jgi:hypothetical protein